MSIFATTRRLMLTLAAAVVCLGTFSSAATAAPARDASPCKNGGFSKYLDPRTGHAFVDQGTCVSFVKNGGALQYHFTGTVAFSQVPWPRFPEGVTPTACEVTFDIQGITGPTFEQVLVNGVPLSTTPDILNTGTTNRYSVVIQEGDALDVVVGGETFSTVGDCLPAAPPAQSFQLTLWAQSGTTCQVGFDLAEEPFSTHTVQWIIDGVPFSFDGTTPWVDTLQAGEGGRLQASFIANDGQTVVAVVDGAASEPLACTAPTG